MGVVLIKPLGDGVLSKRRVEFKVIPFILSSMNFDLEPDYSEHGLQCENKCGIDGFYEGRHWCYTVSKYSNSWDYCTPRSKILMPSPSAWTKYLLSQVKKFSFA